MSYRRTDRTRFPQLSESIRMNLSAGLMEKLDAEAVGQIITDVGSSRVTASAADSFDSYRKRAVYDRIDGRFVTMEGQIRLLVASATLGDMSALYRDPTSDVSAVESLRRLTGGVKVSPHIAAPVSNKQDVIVRKNARRDFVMPIWRGVEMIYDEITKARTGEVQLTAVAQAAHKTIREEGFAIVQSQHS